jgi:DNA polymerase-3 subunit alpha
MKTILITQWYEPKNEARRKELELLEKEKQELGIYVTKHPIEGMWSSIAPSVTGEIVDILEMGNGASVKVGGILTSVKRMITKKGQKMFRLLLEDLSGEIEVIIFPRESKNINDNYFNEGDVVIITGSINRENEEETAIVKLFFNACEKVDTSRAIGSKSIMLSFPMAPSLEMVQGMCDIIENVNGPSYVYLDYIEGNKKVTFKFKKSTSIKVEEKLKEYINIRS